MYTYLCVLSELTKTRWGRSWGWGWVIAKQSSHSCSGVGRRMCMFVGPAVLAHLLIITPKHCPSTNRWIFIDLTLRFDFPRSLFAENHNRRRHTDNQHWDTERSVWTLCQNNGHFTIIPQGYRRAIGHTLADAGRWWYLAEVSNG